MEYWGLIAALFLNFGLVFICFSRFVDFRTWFEANGAKIGGVTLKDGKAFVESDVVIGGGSYVRVLRDLLEKNRRQDEQLAILKKRIDAAILDIEHLSSFDPSGVVELNDFVSHFQQQNKTEHQLIEMRLRDLEMQKEGFD